MQAVEASLKEQGIEVKGSELTMVPNNPTDLNAADAKKVERLVDRLEELDDVQNVYAAMCVSDEVLAELEAEE